MAQKRRTNENKPRASRVTETGNRGDKEEPVDLIYRIADEVMSLMAREIRAHTGQADANVAANAASLAMAYSLAMTNPSEREVEAFMEATTEETKGIVQATAPVLEAAQSLKELDLDQDTWAKAVKSLAQVSGESKTVN